MDALNNYNSPDEENEFAEEGEEDAIMESMFGEDYSDEDVADFINPD